MKVWIPLGIFTSAYRVCVVSRSRHLKYLTSHTVDELRLCLITSSLSFTIDNYNKNNKPCFRCITNSSDLCSTKTHLTRDRYKITWYLRARIWSTLRSSLQPVSTCIASAVKNGPCILPSNFHNSAWTRETTWVIELPLTFLFLRYLALEQMLCAA